MNGKMQTVQRREASLLEKERKQMLLDVQTGTWQRSEAVQSTGADGCRQSRGGLYPKADTRDVRCPKGIAVIKKGTHVQREGHCALRPYISLEVLGRQAAETKCATNVNGGVSTAEERDRRQERLNALLGKKGCSRIESPPGELLWSVSQSKWNSAHEKVL
jgi:hypothetical protein